MKTCKQHSDLLKGCSPPFSHLLLPFPSASRLGQWPSNRSVVPEEHPVSSDLAPGPGELPAAGGRLAQHRGTSRADVHLWWEFTCQGCPPSSNTWGWHFVHQKYCMSQSHLNVIKQHCLNYLYMSKGCLSCRVDPYLEHSSLDWAQQPGLWKWMAVEQWKPI